MLGAIEVLSIWELANRLEGLDPERETVETIPVSVRDNIRRIAQAMVQGEISAANNKGIERYRDFAFASQTTRLPAEEVGLRLDAVTYERRLDRAFLDAVYVTQWSYREWCEASRLQVPEFWLWHDAVGAPETALAGVRPVTASVTQCDSETDSECMSDSHTVTDSLTLPASTSASQSSGATGDESERRALRPNQRHKERCRAIAEMMWSSDPSMTIAALILTDEITKFGCQCKIYSDGVLRDWVNDLAPNRSPGRPRKAPETKSGNGGATP